MMKQFILSVCLLMFLGGSVHGQATLPVSTTTMAKGSLPTGFSHSGLGTDYSGPHLKFDTQDDNLILFFDAVPGELSFELGVNNSFPGTIPATATFSVLESSDGVSYSTVASYIDMSGGTKTVSTLNTTSRYIKWEYTTKPSGTNIAFRNVSLAAGSSITPAVTIASASQVSTSSPEQNTDNVILSFFDITVADAAATLESLAFSTSGTYASTDIKTDGFKLWKYSDATFADATQIGSSVSSASGTGETITFSSLANEIAIGTSYFWITTDIASDATAGNTISVDAIANTGFTFTSADKSGSVTAGGTQTIAAATVPLISFSETSLSFGNVEAGEVSSDESFTVSGDNLTANVYIIAPSGFSLFDSATNEYVSSIELTQSGGNLVDEPVTVYARFEPSSASGTNSETITIASSGQEFESEYLAVSGFAYTSQPETPATDLSFTSIGTSSFTINWTDGSGDSVLVVMKSGSAVDFEPEDVTAYDVNAVFGTSTQLGTGNYGVYKGTGSSVTVTGLSSSTTYHVALFEFNVGSGSLTHNYNVSSTLVGSEETTTPPPVYFYISEVADPTDNTNARYVELFNAGTTTIDFAVDTYYFVRQANGGSLSSTQLTGTIASYATYTIAYQQSGFNTEFGLEPDLVFGSVTGNGDDSYWIATDNTSDATLKSTIVDIYGVVDVDGSSQNWEYTDKRALRNVSVAQANSSWTSSEWTITSANAADFDPSEHNFAKLRKITGSAGYRMLSSPISGFTVSDISDNTAIQGVAGGDNSEGFSSNFYYFGSTGAWTAPTDVNTTFGDGYGFITKFFNNTSNGSSELPITLDVTGTEPSEDVVTALNKTVMTTGTAEEGSAYYTLLGNPFASNLDLSSLTVDNSGSLSANVVIWDNTAGDYATLAKASSVIAPWQGFWAFVLDSDEATTITFPISGKTASEASATYFKAATAPIEGLMTLSHGETTSHPFKVFLHENAKMSFDIYDVSKFTPLSDSYAVIGGRQVANSSLKAIESLPMELNEVVELAIVPQLVGISGEFTIKWSQFAQFPESFSVELQDSETGEVYNLREDGMVVFTLDSAQKAALTSNDIVLSGGSERFKVVISPITTSVEAGNLVPTHVELSQNFPNPFNPSTTIRYAVPAQSNVRLAVYDMLGREVAVLVNSVNAAGNFEFAFDASSLSSGMYMYRLEAAGTVLTRKMTLIK